MIIQLIIFIVCSYVCSMEGVLDDEHLRGLMPSSFHYIFDCVKAAPSSTQFLVRASFVEVYKDDVYDLLNTTTRAKLELKESPDKGVYVKDLSEFRVNSVEDCIKCLRVGQKQRKVGATKMNEGSSRSHSILSITIETSTIIEGAKEPSYRSGKLNLVDLAGSERQKKTEASGDRLDEAKSINWSLTVLGNCIKALIDPHAKHVPYRDSKLTRLLQDSLGGNTKTLMIANIGPSHLNAEETMATLRYADRAKQIKNKPVINADPKDTMLKEMQDEIARLKAELAMEIGDASADVDDSLMEEDSEPMVLADGSTVSASGKKVVVTKVVERVVEVGISAAELERLEQEHAAKLAQLESDHAYDAQQLQTAKEELAQQKAEIEAKLNEKAALIQRKREHRAMVRNQLGDLEAQLIGGQKLIDQASSQAAELEAHREELERQKVDRVRLETELRDAEDRQSAIAQKFDSLDAALADQHTKWSKLLEKYESLTQEHEHILSQQSTEREELMQAVRELSAAISFKDALLTAFIPHEEQESVIRRCVYDPEQQQYTIKQLSSSEWRAKCKPPPSCRPKHRVPISDFTLRTRGTAAGQTPRFKSDNLIQLELDMPERTTQDLDD